MRVWYKECIAQCSVNGECSINIQRRKKETAIKRKELLNLSKACKTGSQAALCRRSGATERHLEKAFPSGTPTCNTLQLENLHFHIFYIKGLWTRFSLREIRIPWLKTLENYILAIIELGPWKGSKIIFKSLRKLWFQEITNLITKALK